MQKSAIQPYKLYILIFMIPLFLTSCNIPAKRNPTLPSSPISPNITDQQTSINFRAKINQPLSTGESLFLSILDEVTGLPFNFQKYRMNLEDSTTYSMTLSLPLGSVIKYRYSREGAGNFSEMTYDGRQVRYRIYYVGDSSAVEDTVIRWTDVEYAGKVGRVTGQVLETGTEKPIPNLLISVAGEQAFTRADGLFDVDGLPPGKHNILFYALDGKYLTFQQEVIVGNDSTTPVAVHLSPTPLVTVIFAVKVPADTPPDVPLRIAGNLSQLGNTFSDLPGGVSALTSNMPLLGRLPDGRFMATLKLPAGTYIEYKYTLGDGLWSSELTKDGLFKIRHLIVPPTTVELNDVVETWHRANTKPIRFETKIPSATPSGESVSIQFNPGVRWFEPLPMQPGVNSNSESIWIFDLTGPFKDLGQVKYRYCRQEQCGIADDEATPGTDTTGRSLNLSTNPSLVNDEVIKWAWYNAADQTAVITDTQVIPRGMDFIAGISYQPNFNPSWVSNFNHSTNTIKGLKVNWLILSPTWSFANKTIPILEPDPSHDMLWDDIIDTITQAQNNGLITGLYPIPRFLMQKDLWWQNATRNYSWWVTFYEQYSNFILHNASIAATTNSGSLVLGGPWIKPALPDGKLSDGSPSNTPQDSESRWRVVIQKVRERYSGKIAWMLQYPDDLKNPPAFLNAVDQIMILWAAPIALNQDSSIEEMKTQASLILSQEIFPVQQQFNKPIILAIAYPSITSGSMGCFPDIVSGCLEDEILQSPAMDANSVEINLQDQAKAYYATLSAINDTSWISGFISMGYYPPAMIQDKSTSINGKPASGIVWYWSQKFLGR